MSVIAAPPGVATTPNGTSPFPDVLAPARGPSRGGPGREASPVHGWDGGWLLRLPYPVRTVLRRWRGLVGMVAGTGIALGIGMLMLGVSKAKVGLYASNFVEVGADLYVVQKGGTLVPLLPSDTTGSISRASGVISQVRGIKGVRSAVGITLGGLAQEVEGRRATDEPAALVTAMGVDGDPTAIKGLLVLKEGRWIRRPDEVMVGTTLAREKRYAVGDPLRLSGRTFTVVGIGRLRGSSFGTEGFAYVDYRVMRERTGAPDSMGLLLVDVEDGAEAASLVAGARTAIAEIAPVATFDPGQLVELANVAMQASFVFSWLMISLVLGIAALFVSNVLGRSVAERRAEFATLRAIGLPARTVLATVAGEAAVIVCLAWAFGMGLAWGLGAWTNAFIEEAYGIENMYIADPPLFVALFGISVVVGIGAGLVPARQATGVDPVEVLRDA